MSEADNAPLTDEQIAEQFPGQDVAHIRAMVDKMDGKGVETHPNADSPEGGDGDDNSEKVEYPAWIPEKFRQGSVSEAMQKLAESYSVLEGARGKSEATDGDAAADTGDSADSPDTPLDLNDLEAKFVANGNKLTEAEYAEAAKYGMSKEFVDSYMAGQVALADQLVSRVHSMVGGSDTYNAMLQWATGNLPEADISEYDAAMASGNQSRISMAVRGLKASYDEAVGTTPGRRVNGENNAPAAQGFQSKAEMVKAIQDPRYKKDPAYRAEVARKIQEGNVW